MKELFKEYFKYISNAAIFREKGINKRQRRHICKWIQQELEYDSTRFHFEHLQRQDLFEELLEECIQME